MYTPEQVTLAADRMRVACREELEIERMLYAYAATLRQTPERGVTEAMVERVSLAIYARAMESGKRLEPTFCDDLATAALSAQPADSKVIGDDSQIKPGERVPEISWLADQLCDLRNQWAEGCEANWLETDDTHPDDWMAKELRKRWLAATPAAPAEEGAGKEGTP